MATTQAVTREPAGNSGARDASAGPTNAADRGNASDDARDARSVRARRSAPSRTSRIATDDEILGLDPGPASAVGAQHAVPGEDAWLDAERQEQVPRSQTAGARDDNGEEVADGNVTTDATAEPEHLRAALDANPELRQAWQDANSYRESFATPEEARAATALLADLDRMDALFFSRRPEDHAELARAVANLDPDAFASLAHAMSSFATESQTHGANTADGRPTTAAYPVAAQRAVPGTDTWRDVAHLSSHSNSIVIPRPGEAGRAEEPVLRRDRQEQVARSQTAVARNDNALAGQPSAAQVEFFHAANAAAVRNVLDAIETQVERLLPESVSKNARNRVVGEIYRELDGALRSNRQLGQQMRDAFRAGALDGDHQRAVVSLITSRARQALPGVAKRVLSEWTSTVLAANQDRRARQRAAESRVDIAGSGGAGNDGRRSLSPRDIDYARLSDSDILNM